MKTAFRKFFEATWNIYLNHFNTICNCKHTHFKFLTLIFHFDYHSKCNGMCSSTWNVQEYVHGQWDVFIIPDYAVKETDINVIKYNLSKPKAYLFFIYPDQRYYYSNCGKIFVRKCCYVRFCQNDSYIYLDQTMNASLSVSTLYGKILVTCIMTNQIIQIWVIVHKTNFHPIESLITQCIASSIRYTCFIT